MENEIWKYFEGEYKAHCSEKVDYSQMKRLKDVRAGGVYFFKRKNVGYDVIFPESQLKKIMQILNVNEVSEVWFFDTKRLLKDKYLQEMKLSLRDLKMECDINYGYKKLVAYKPKGENYE